MWRDDLFRGGAALCGIAWLVLVTSGFVGAHVIQLPGWTAPFLMVAVISGSALFILGEHLHRLARFLALIVWLTSLLALSWFNGRAGLTLYFWFAILLLGIEVYWVVPFLRKKRKARRGSPERDGPDQD